MGRWKQYRSRGRGQESAPAFPLDPPGLTVAFMEQHDGYHLAGVTDIGFPAPATSAQFQWRKPPETAWTPTSPYGEAVGPVDETEGIADDVYEWQSRWLDVDESPVSDWSATQTVTMLP